MRSQRGKQKEKLNGGVSDRTVETVGKDIGEKGHRERMRWEKGKDEGGGDAARGGEGGRIKRMWGRRHNFGWILKNLNLIYYNILILKFTINWGCKQSCQPICSSKVPPDDYIFQRERGGRQRASDWERGSERDVEREAYRWCDVEPATKCARAG